MFENAGTKIRKYAKVIFWIATVGVFILAIVSGFEAEYDMWDEPEHSFHFLPFIKTLTIGLVLCYLETLILSAFGELVENSRKNAENTAKLIAMHEAPTATFSNVAQTAINGHESVAEQSAAAYEEEETQNVEAEEAPEAEAIPKPCLSARELLEYALQFRGENGCRDYIKARMKDVDESEIAVLEPINRYLEMAEPNGIKAAIAQILGER